MGELNIRLDDAELVDALSRIAVAHERSIESEIHELLRQAVKERTRRLELLRRADAIAAMTPRGVVQTDSTILIREDRDREG